MNSHKQPLMTYNRRRVTSAPLQAYLSGTVGEVFHRRAQAFALDGGDPLVVVVRHEVAVDARLRKPSSLQLLKQQGASSGERRTPHSSKKIADATRDRQHTKLNGTTRLLQGVAQVQPVLSRWLIAFVG